MTISALPTPPTRSDPENFASRGDAFVAALPQFVSEVNAQVAAGMGNASTLLGATWAAPGAIGSGTPNSGAFVGLSASGKLSITGGSYGAPSGNGEAYVYASASLGNSIYGKGSTNDITLIGNLGNIVATVPTSTSTFALAGLVDLSAAAAGQIKFPGTQNASANANTLDDYEEGSWTPVRVGFTEVIGGGSITNTGTYTKVGNEVTVIARLACAGGATLAAAAGSSLLTGLPFTAGSAYSAGCWANASAVGAGGVIIGDTTLYVNTSWSAAESTWALTATYFV